MWLIHFYILFSIFALFPRHHFCKVITDEKEAWKSLLKDDQLMYYHCLYGNGSWDNIATENFAWKDFTDPLVRRAFELIAEGDYYFGPFNRLVNSTEMKRYFDIWEEKDYMLYNSKVCSYQTKDVKDVGRNCSMETMYDIILTVDKSEKNDERKYYWVAWHDEIGKMRAIYDENLQLLNKLNFFPDFNDWWMFHYGKPTVLTQEESERAFQEIFPLYKELHAYVRRRLSTVYGTKVVTSEGPIPSHLLGVREYEGWRIMKQVLPYPEQELKLTEKLQLKNITAIGMLKIADDFYRSLGFPHTISDVFWSNIHIATNKLCYYELNYSCNHEILGMKGCFPVTGENLHKLTGIISKIYRISLKPTQLWPTVLTSIATPALKFALDFVGVLSSWTTGYLSKIGLAEDVPMKFGEVTERDINQLMEVAIRFLTILPSIYKTAKWKWDAYGFVLSNSNYNKRWWEYSLKYQGVCPAVRRTEDDFDPASSIYLATNDLVIRDFIAIIYGFQFYEAACKEAGHKDLLHRCNLYGVKTFGDKFRKIVNLGKSINGSEAIYIMTNGEYDNMDTKPLLKYFRPLYERLRKENEGGTVGWKSGDPMVCP